MTEQPVWELTVCFLTVGPAVLAWAWFADAGTLGGFVAGVLMVLSPALAFGKWQRPWLLRPPRIIDQG